MDKKLKVYADNAATTRLCEESFEKMVPFMRDQFFNPSGKYTAGVETRSAINVARHTLASSIGSFDKEILFTAGGSESDNLALKGVMEANRDKGRHLIISSIEHHAIMEAAESLKKNGCRVTVVNPGPDGVVNPLDIEAAITEDTVLVSVMYANNEIGSLQPIKEIAKITKNKGVLFHTDAVQAYGKLKIDVNELGVDLLSASAHKFNGPKGAGFLYVRSGVRISPLINGGSQERRLRGGTENVPAIIGMAEAAKISLEKMDERYAYEAKLKVRLWQKIKSEISGVKINGSFENALPGILNISIDGAEGESLVILMDMRGVSIATGSACAESLEEPSHVIRGIGGTEEDAKSSIRISLNHDNTMEEVDYIVECLKESVEYLRELRI